MYNRSIWTISTIWCNTYTKIFGISSDVFKCINHAIDKCCTIEHAYWLAIVIDNYPAYDNYVDFINRFKNITKEENDQLNTLARLNSFKGIKTWLEINGK